MCQYVFIFILNIKSYVAFHECCRSLTSCLWQHFLSECAASADEQILYGGGHWCFKIKHVTWPPSRKPFKRIIRLLKHTRIHNYRQKPRLPSYSLYPGKSSVWMHLTRIRLFSWLVFQSPPFIKLKEWVLLTLWGWKWRGWISVTG